MLLLAAFFPLLRAAPTSAPVLPGRILAADPPMWANLINEIGNATTCDHGAGYWSNTAIFITWDDWGGFYDHVAPPAVYRSTDPNQCPPGIAPNGWGCGYTYGFRVPLLVVSAYTQAHYVSGGLTGPPVYPPPPKYTHDFGSILAFIENNFNLGLIYPRTNYYADANAIDSINGQFVPLWDFFQWPYKDFVPISPTNSLYNANYFQNYYVNNNLTPMGPDGGDDD